MILYRTHAELAEAAESGDMQAQYELAIGLMTGFCKGEKIDVDSPQAFGWLMKAAEQGHAAAMENIGRAFLHGYVGVDAGNRFLRIDRAVARDWLLKAVVAGAAGACRELGIFYRYEDPHKAAEYFYKAAYYFGDTLALRYYAEALLTGDGVDQDTAAGRKVLASALSMDADLTAADAMMLAAAYEMPIEAPADTAAQDACRARAQIYYMTALQRRAAAGDPAGQHELAMRLYLGDGLAQDMAAARNWLARAAEGGYPPAQRQVEALARLVRH
ncbi:MAG: hypothetical protein Q8K65_11485 [Alphaproteobacteria bacterium]|nr:hypothetical protein [Alphaproteobacteria bacterium]